MTTVVRYTVRPERAEENADLVRAVYAGFAERCEPGPDVSPSEVIGSFG